MATTAPVLFTKSTVGLTIVAKILSFGWSGIERSIIETTHTLSSSFREFMPGDLADPGNLSAEIEFEPLLTQMLSDIAAAAASISIDFNGGGAGNLGIASGFMSSFSIDGQNEEMMTASVGIKFTGAITTV